MFDCHKLTKTIIDKHTMMWKVRKISSFGNTNNEFGSLQHWQEQCDKRVHTAVY